MKKNLYQICIAILGVIIGVLLSSIVTRLHNGNQKDWKYGSWNKLALVLDYVSSHYVDTIDMKAVTDAAIDAALSELDPHSVYLPPVEREQSEESLAGNFEGIGIQFNVPTDTAIVLNVISGGPSQKAGLVQGDRIIKVDDRVIAGVKMPQDSMVRYMKGPSGSKVVITVKRGAEMIPFNITRGRIPVASVDAAFMVDDTTAYVKLSKFTMTTYSEFLKASADLLSQGMKSMIFDLRGNSGGYFDQAYKLANEFLGKGDMVVYMQGLHYPRKDFPANGKGFLQDIALTVLIDESSASSSEIFAGAIQDNDRGVIYGRRSFGKGLVQEPVNFTDGSGIRLTVARYFTPSGRCIQKPYTPGTDDYATDIYERYLHGEMLAADSMKVDKSQEYRTVSGRVVYGGGGIIPDVFVPIDTTKATEFFVKCNKKTTQMRFASAFFDSHRDDILAISDYKTLESYLVKADVEGAFLRYAASKDSIVPKPGEWEQTKEYMLPQVKALVGRYSSLGENAFYHLYLRVDPVIEKVLGDK